MKTMKLLFRLRYVSSHNSRQQRCLLHTCLPLMNKENSTEKKQSNKSDGFSEQPHMRVHAKAIAEEKRMYKEK